MLDIKFIRDNVDLVTAGLKAKKTDVDLNYLLDLDKERRGVLLELEEFRSKKNAANDEISKLLKAKEDPKEKIDAMKSISSRIGELEGYLKEYDVKMYDILIGIPNVPDSSVPVGPPTNNKEIRTWGDLSKFDFKPKTHIELGEQLDIIDFKRGAKISGSNFIVYKNEGARLERALINFMLDLHTSDHGYNEIFPPYLVNRASMTGTGQLPKMEEDMYKLQDDDFFLIPTAEVPITNLHRDEVLKEEDLPVLYTGYTACFRREAGSYGKDTKGLMRLHQFNKVELVKFVKPEGSYDELEKLVANAEKVFQLLKIPYRILLLASGDLSFAAAKCYDIEVKAAATEKWLEASSCSNFEDFQARRSNIRFKGKETKKPIFVHTLNGSGVATPRTMIAILENYQTKDGEILIPDVLQPYMGGKKKIERQSC